MTQDDIALMYQKANGWSPAPYKITMEELERFSQLVVAHEREACALECINIANKPSNIILGVALDCAEAIRSRGNNDQPI